MDSLPYPSGKSQLVWGSFSGHQSHCRVLARVPPVLREGHETGGQAEAGDTAAADQGSISSPSPGPLGQRKPRQEDQSCHQPARPMKHPPLPPVILPSEPQHHGSSFGIILRLGAFCSLYGPMPSPPALPCYARRQFSSLMSVAPTWAFCPQAHTCYSPPFRKFFLLSDLSPSCCSLSPNLFILSL